MVHFVTIHKQLTNRKQHPRFLVEKVYDTVERKLRILSDKDYMDNKQQAIDELLQKTLHIETKQGPTDQEELMNSEKGFRRKILSPLDVSREKKAIPMPDQHLKYEIPASCLNSASKHYHILANFNALTGYTYRDKWLERLLQSVQYMCNSHDNVHVHRDDKGKDNSAGINHGSNNRSLETTNGCQDKGQKVIRKFSMFGCGFCELVTIIFFSLFPSFLRHFDSVFYLFYSTGFEIFYLARYCCSSCSFLGKSFT